MTTKSTWIAHLHLEPHAEEGGYFRHVFVSDSECAPPEWLGDPRRCWDTIYYMLTDDSPIGVFHKNRADIIHFFHDGSPLHYILIDSAGTVTHRVLGPEPELGHELQIFVAGGTWKATELTGGSYGLVSEAVIPAFDPRDREFADSARLLRYFPSLDQRLLRFTIDGP